MWSTIYRRYGVYLLVGMRRHWLNKLQADGPRFEPSADTVLDYTKVTELRSVYYKYYFFNCISVTENTLIRYLYLYSNTHNHYH